MIRLSYVSVLLSLLLYSCGDHKEESQTPTSPRVKKTTRMESPGQNQSFTRGAVIEMVYSSSDEAIDSVQLTIDEETKTYYTSAFVITLPTRRVGGWTLRSKVFYGADSDTHYRKITILPESEPQEMTYTVVNTYPHDEDDYTQGLLIKDGFLYESTGQQGKSAFKKKNLRTGETLQSVNLANNLFGEGLAWINDEFYQLTWTSGKGLVYNSKMEQTRTFSYNMQGWGLTTLGDELVFTDETEKLYFIAPQSFTVLRELEVHDHKGKVDALNELEVINGLIYANVYQEDYIVVVDPNTGEVLQKIDFTGLLTEEEREAADVLNGIASDPENGKIYVTGKWWPKLFEVTIEPKTIQ